MGASVENGAEAVQGTEPMRRTGGPIVRLRLLGPLRVEHAGRTVALPPSRKARALLGYLALSPRPVLRAKLCDLLWDIANDPRGELRWCLAKLRPLLGAPDQPGLISDHERIAIDMSGIDIDALHFARSIEAAIADSSGSGLKLLLGMIEGDLLEGLALERSPAFEARLAAERERFTRWHERALVRLAALLPTDSADLIDVLRRRLVRMPYDEHAHVDLMTALVAQGRQAEAERLLNSATKLFESEGLSVAALRRAFVKPSMVTGGHPATVETKRESKRLGDLSAGPAVPSEQPDAHRPSIVVMPFAAKSAADTELANGLTYDIIFGIAKLRSLMIIARGTAFALRDRALSPMEAATLLGVRYVASGTVSREGERLLVQVELSSSATGQIVWAAQFSISADETFTLLGTITSRIVAGIDSEVHITERNRALLRPPNSLDAWQAYHRGLWHMYRFKGPDNDEAQQFFLRAIERDPTFSRSHAGLSFTHFQNAFLLKSKEREPESNLAFEAAGRAMMADPRDPAAHWAVGRALWLRGEVEASIRALDEAVDISPNFANAHYARAFVYSQGGDPQVAISAAETARRLSPFDPMIFAIHSAKVFGLLRLDRRAEAAQLARHVVGQPNVHVHARALAALSLAVGGHIDEARTELAMIRGERPGYDIAQFLSAFRLRSDLERIYREAASLIGAG